MAAARYWRVVGWGVPAAGLVLNTFEMAFGGARVDAAATITSTLAPNAGSVGALADGDGATGCAFDVQTAHAPGFALHWDMGVEQDVDELRLAGPDAARWPLTIDLQSRRSPSDPWAPVVTVSSIPWPGAGTTAVLRVEDYQTRILLHFDGQDNGTSFADAAPVPLAKTLVGTPRTMAAQSVFGGASGYFNQQSAVQIGVLGDEALAPHAADFCIEAWLYRSSLGGGHRNIAAGNNSASGPGPTLIFVMISTAGALSCAVRQGATAFTVNAGAAPPQNTWFHAAMSRQGTALRVFVNGTLAGAVTLTEDFDVRAGAGYFTVGRAGDYHQISGDTATTWYGYIDEFRFVIGRPVYTTAFTPPAAPHTGGAAQQPSSHRLVGGLTGASADMPTTRHVVGAGLRGRDLEFGGRARITGDVGIKGASGAPDTMVKSRVRLLRQRDGLLARETWSDPVTGAFAFDGLDEHQQFIALAEDGSGVYAPVAADRRVPEVLP